MSSNFGLPSAINPSPSPFSNPSVSGNIGFGGFGKTSSLTSNTAFGSSTGRGGAFGSTVSPSTSGTPGFSSLANSGGNTFGSFTSVGNNFGASGSTFGSTPQAPSSFGATAQTGFGGPAGTASFGSSTFGSSSSPFGA